MSERRLGTCVLKESEGWRFTVCGQGIIKEEHSQVEEGRDYKGVWRSGLTLSWFTGSCLTRNYLPLLFAVDIVFLSRFFI